MNQSYSSNLTDEQWQLLQGLIPPAKPGGRPRSVDMQAEAHLLRVFDYLYTTEVFLLVRAFGIWDLQNT